MSIVFEIAKESIKILDLFYSILFSNIKGYTHTDNEKAFEITTFHLNFKIHAYS